MNALVEVPVKLAARSRRRRSRPAHRLAGDLLAAAASPGFTFAPVLLALISRRYRSTCSWMISWYLFSASWISRSAICLFCISSLSSIQTKRERSIRQSIFHVSGDWMGSEWDGMTYSLWESWSIWWLYFLRFLRVHIHRFLLSCLQLTASVEWIRLHVDSISSQSSTHNCVLVLRFTSAHEHPNRLAFDTHFQIVP